MRVRPAGLVLCLLAVALTGSQARATSFLPPTRHDVYSPNRAYVLDVDPDRGVNTVYTTADRATPLWSFSEFLWRRHPLLSNDGSVVVILQSGYVEEQDIPDAVAVWFINKDGAFRSYALAELCPHPRRTSDVGGGPVGDSWRTWYTEVRSDGEAFTVETTGGRTYQFRFSDGAITDRRWNSWVMYRWWFAAGVVGLPAVGLAGVVLWRRRRPTWPRERRALAWGCVWFAGSLVLCLVASLLVSAAIAGGRGEDPGPDHLRRAVARHRAGIAVAVAVATVAGLYGFIAWARWGREPGTLATVSRAGAPPTSPGVVVPPPAGPAD